MPDHSFDVVVIGAGSAAASVLSRCRAAGWSTAVIDSGPYGGTCQLRGCDPKKILVAAGEAMDWLDRMRGRGIDPGDARVNWSDLVASKRAYTDPIPAARAQRLRKRGTATFDGRARFTGPSTVQVDDDVLEARNVVVATGARPRPLGIPGEEHVTTSDRFMELDELPARILFIGGGYISCEFAHLARRAGAEVRVVDLLGRLLQPFDRDLVTMLDEHTRNLGIDVELNLEISGVDRTDEGLTVVGMRDGERFEFTVDLVVHGAGRAPDIDDLHLEAAGVEAGRKGIVVDHHLRSVTNDRVFAAGDCADTGGAPLTPVAAMESRIVAATLLGQEAEIPHYGFIPSVVFTVPPLSAVGLGEAQAQAQGLDFRTNTGSMAGWQSYRRSGEQCAGYKVLIENGTERILGAHLLGTHTDELINMFALAMRHGLTALQLRQTVFGYPTHGSDVQYMLG